MNGHLACKKLLNGKWHLLVNALKILLKVDRSQYKYWRNIMELRAGQPAPDFSLQSHLEKKITLSSLRGSNVIIVFFPLAWTPV